MLAKNPLLLVVGDNPNQQKVINILAMHFGFEAVLVGTRAEALSALVTCNTFRVILIDSKVADLELFRCAAKMRALEKFGRHTPIIAVIAHAGSVDGTKCSEGGMDDCLSKPFKAEGFRRMLLKWTYNPDQPNLRLLQA
jgi:CheY-like chemotaxis protein